MNRELRKVRKWLDANHLALNIDKTNFVIFHSPQKIILDPVILKIGKKKISNENCVKFLGVLLDSGLSWKHHIAELSKKLARTVGIFYKVRHLIPLETLKILYYSLFYSFVSYGITVWGLTHKSYLDPIIIAQKKILRVMTFSEINAHTAPLFSQLGILKIHDVHQFQLLSFVYDCHYKIAPAHFHCYFKPSSDVHNYNTRMASRGDLFLQRKHTFQYGIRYIQYTGARLWNMIPVSLRSSPSSSVFRSELKTYLLSNYDMLS